MILLIILIYIGLLFFSSNYSKRRKGHNPWYVVAISMISTSISGVSFVSVPGMVEASEFSYLQMVLGFIAGYIVIAFVLLPVYYKLRLNNLYDYLKERFGNFSYKTGAAFFLLSKLLGTGVKMYLSAIVLQVIVFEGLGVPFWINVIICVLVTYLYTLRGLKSLVWTDMVQTISLLIVVGLSIVIINKELEPIHINSRVFFFDNPDDTKFFFKQFFAGMFTTIAMTGLDQDMMQKNLSCRSLKDSQKNVLSYGLGFLPVNLLFLCLGVLLYQYAAANALVFSKPDELFPTVACSMPLIVKVLFVLGLVSATLSSSGSSLNAMTTIIMGLGLPRHHASLVARNDGNKINIAIPNGQRQTTNFKQQTTNNKQQQTTNNNLNKQQLQQTNNYNLLGLGTDVKQLQVISRLTITIILGLSIILFQFIGNQSVINAVYTIASYTYGPLLGLFAIGIFSKIKLKDRLVPIVCVLSPIICWGIYVSCRLFWNYTIGFELLLINATITIVGLYFIKLPLYLSQNNK